MGNVRMRAEQIDYGATNVKAALDDLDVSDLLKLNARMDKIDAWKDTVEVTTLTGNPVTFNNALAVPAIDCEATLSPIQDLHGYDNPWAPGASDQMLDESTVEAGMLNQTTGAEEPSTTVKRSDYMPTRGATDIYTSATGGMRYFWYDSSKGYLSNDATTPNNSIAVPNDAAYFRVIAANAVWGESDIMVNSGTTAKPYCPYSNICPISGRTEARVDTENEDSTESAYAVIQLGTTVYGGEVNFDTGVATVDHGFNTFDGSSSTGWSYVSDYGSVSRFDCTTVVGKAGGNVISNYLKGGNDTSIIPNEEHAYLHGSYGYLIICVETSRLATKDVAGLMSYLESNPLQVCYELATTTTIQLTPTQLELLKGYNRVTSTDADSLTVKVYTGAAWGGDET